MASSSSDLNDGALFLDESQFSSSYSSLSGVSDGEPSDVQMIPPDVIAVDLESKLLKYFLQFFFLFGLREFGICSNQSRHEFERCISVSASLWTWWAGKPSFSCAMTLVSEN